jgi:signal peptidase I
MAVARSRHLLPSRSFAKTRFAAGLEAQKRIGWRLASFGLALVAIGVSVRAVSVDTVNSSSMEPTLHCAHSPGCTRLRPDHVIVNRFAYLFGRPSRGDIVVITLAGRPLRRCGGGRSLVKRIIALPGDRIWQRRTSVYVNGERLREPYVPSSEKSARSFSAVTLGDGEYYALGDNRKVSCDSRDFGAISSREITGKVEFVYSGPLGIRLP